MKTAREMFEELGYECSETKTEIIYKHKKDHIHIKFDKEKELFDAGLAFYRLNDEDFIAIGHQMQELGWFE